MKLVSSKTPKKKKLLFTKALSAFMEQRSIWTERRAGMVTQGSQGGQEDRQWEAGS